MDEAEGHTRSTGEPGPGASPSGTPATESREHPERTSAESQPPAGTADRRPVLHGERATLRPLRADDIPRVLAIVTHPEIAEWWIDYDAETLRRELLEDESVSAFAIERSGAVIGVIMYDEELDPNYRYAMIDVTVDADHVGQGLGTDALRTLARFLIDVRGHHRIMIDPAAVNGRAIAAYKKVGFKPIGIMRRYERGPNGVWRDSLLMDLLAEELT